MNILIAGAGAVGIALGASMLSQGENVSFLAGGKTYEAINYNGIERTGIFSHLKFSSDSFDCINDLKFASDNEFDYVFVASKTLANSDIAFKLHTYKNCLKKGAVIIIFQNGYGNDSPYLKYFDASQVFCARVITGFRRPERNISEITVHTAPILLGSLQGQSTKALEPVAKAISASGIECEVTDKLSEFLWAKMLYNCTLNPLGAILGVTYGKLGELENTREIMNKIIEEIFAVLNAAGFKVPWNTPDEYKNVFYSKLLPDTYAHVSSTLQDIQRKQKTEIDSLTGKVIEIAKKYNVPVPVNETIYNIIKGIEFNA